MTANIQFISAGAGSGKTYELTQQLEALLVSGEVSPSGVIATTFTKLAAGELKERVRGKLIAAGQLNIANQMEQSLIGTVNGVCGQLVQRFAFEAGLPPDQIVLDESQGNILFYQAMEQALSRDKPLIRDMNATCHRLQITNSRTKQLLWRSEVNDIADAARANNQSPSDIRGQGTISADELLTHFPKASKRKLDDALLSAISQAMAGIDTEIDNTQATRKYLSLITGVQAALVNQRATWSEWIKLSKDAPGAKNKKWAESIQDIAKEYEKHPKLHEDIRFFAEKLFEIAADSLESYQTLKQQKGLIDFVDQEQRLYHLLDDQSVTETLKEELQLLMVDEFQDTSPIQLALFLKLSTIAKKVIWVGDIKQSIYGFRGSDPDLMQAVVKQVEADGNPPKILAQSWRSRPELVQYVNALFTPAFSNTLSPEQIKLKPARDQILSGPAVETWRLKDGRKDKRAHSLAYAVTELINSGREVIDKQSGETRALTYGDVAVLCKTHSNLGEVATALSNANLPLRYKRTGLLSTPESALAIACLKRLLDPRDTLSSAEIHSLTTCESPEVWIEHRLTFLADDSVPNYQWLEQEEEHPVANLKAQRTRLPYLSPVETLRVAIDAGKVREAVYRWGPTFQFSQHRLNNLSALIDHAESYVDQCTSRSEPATSAGLVLWLAALADADEDTQASGGDENAIQLVTHHGAKGLEWPIVIAMDLEAKLKPRLWGMTVLATDDDIDLNDPLVGRTIRYWPKFSGAQASGVPMLDIIANSPAGIVAQQNETEESKRLLYVSLTRPRDGLILTINRNNDRGPWMETLGSDWMLPTTHELELPDETVIPTQYLEFEDETIDAELSDFNPQWLDAPPKAMDKLRLNASPSSEPPVDSAYIKTTIELGDRVELTGEYDPADLGSCLHAVIAAKINKQTATQRIISEWEMDDVLTVAAAELCANRFIANVEDQFSPKQWFAEHPIQYRNDLGQHVTGWIDLLIKTEDGFVLIDHKASPRARSDWETIALGYSGQLRAYVNGLNILEPAIPTQAYIHFAITGGLLEVALN